MQQSPLHRLAVATSVVSTPFFSLRFTCLKSLCQGLRVSNSSAKVWSDLSRVDQRTTSKKSFCEGLIWLVSLSHCNMHNTIYIDCGSRQIFFSSGGGRRETVYGQTVSLVIIPGMSFWCDDVGSWFSNDVDDHKNENLANSNSNLQIKTFTNSDPIYSNIEVEHNRQLLFVSSQKVSLIASKDNMMLVRSSRVLSKSTVSRAFSTRLADRGMLFSAPCPETYQQEATKVPPPTTRIEKGFLFSAPCLDMNHQGHHHHQQDKNKAPREDFWRSLFVWSTTKTTQRSWILGSCQLRIKWSMIWLILIDRTYCTTSSWTYIMIKTCQPTFITLVRSRTPINRYRSHWMVVNATDFTAPVKSILLQSLFPLKYVVRHVFYIRPWHRFVRAKCLETVVFDLRARLNHALSVLLVHDDHLMVVGVLPSVDAMGPPRGSPRGS